MSLISLFLIAVGLSMDAFAVSVCKGLAMKKFRFLNAFIVGLWFGFFQALMPCIGYVLGNQFEKYITAIDHWVAFALLCIIGISMLREALAKDSDNKAPDASLNVKTMFLLAVATSIDALAIGITFAFLQVQILPAVCLIGTTTFLLSVCGVKVGSVFGTKYEAKAEIAGGIILILMGCKILLEHLEIFHFPI